MNQVSHFVYCLYNFNVWYARLCLINKNITFNLINLDLILKLNFNDLEKI